MNGDNIILAFTIILLLDFAIHSVILVNIWRKTSFTRMFPNGSIARAEREEKARKRKALMRALGLEKKEDDVQT